MNVYRTLLGEEIEWNTLAPKEQKLLGRLYALQEQHTECVPQSDLEPRKLALAYVHEAHAEVRRLFPGESERRQLMRGSVGMVMRDGCYRVHRMALKTSEEKKAFDENLRHNPARLLYDCYLDGWDSQKDFADHAKIKASTVTRTFKFILEPETVETPRLKLKNLRDTFEALGAVPVLVAETRDPRVAEQPMHAESTSVTGRERTLSVLIATVARCLFASAAQPTAEVLSACQRLLGLHLGRLYGVSNVKDLSNLVNNFTRDILAVPELAPLRNEATNEVQVTTDPVLTPAGTFHTSAFFLSVDGDVRKILDPLLKNGPRIKPYEQTETPESDPLDTKFGVDVLLKEWCSAAETNESASSLFKESMTRLQSELEPTELEPLAAELPRELDQIKYSNGPGPVPWEIHSTTAFASGPVIPLSDRSAGAIARSDVVHLLSCTNSEKADQSHLAGGILPLAEMGNICLTTKLSADQGIVKWNVANTGDIGLMDLGRFRDPDAEQEMELTRISEELRIGIFARVDSPCIGAIQIDGPPGTKKKALQFKIPLTKQFENCFYGEHRVPIGDLEKVGSRDELNGTVDFCRPRFTLDRDRFGIPQLPEASGESGDRLAGMARLKSKLISTIILSKMSHWTDETLASWKVWADCVLKPLLGSRPQKAEELARLYELRRMLDWNVYRAVCLMLERKKTDLLAQIDRRLDRNLASLVGTYCAEEAWLFLPYNHGGYRAYWSKNTPYIDHILDEADPSIVKHLGLNGGAYVCRDSRRESRYHEYDVDPVGAPIHRFALAAAVPTVTSGPNRPKDTPGILILESRAHEATTVDEAPLYPGFNAAQMADLEFDALEMAPHLLARKHMLNNAEFCPWHPTFNESHGDHHCWHLIDILEEICHTVVRAINRSGVTCTIWCLDWDYRDCFESHRWPHKGTGGAFVFASTGHVLPLYAKVFGPLLDETGGAAHLLSRAALTSAADGKSYDCTGREAEVCEAFAWLYRTGMRKPKFVPIRMTREPSGSRPALLLALCKSENAKEGELPGDAELFALAKRLGEMVDHFVKLRQEILEVSIRRNLADQRLSCDQSFVMIKKVLREVFQAEVCLVLIKSPETGQWINSPDPAQRRQGVLSSNELPDLEETLKDLRGATGWRWNAIDFKRHRKGLGRLVDREYGSQEASTDEPMRILAETLTLDGATEPELLLLLGRRETDRPFTEFNRELLKSFARLCVPILCDWKLYVMNCPAERGELAIKEQPIPVANGIPARVHTVLRRLANHLDPEGHLKVTLKVVFLCDTQQRTFFCNACYPHEPDRYYKDQSKHLFDLIRTSEQATKFSQEDRRVAVPFSVWVGEQFAEGALLVEVGMPGDIVSIAKSRAGLLRDIRILLSACYSSANDSYRQGDAGLLEYANRCDPELFGQVAQESVILWPALFGQDEILTPGESLTMGSNWWSDLDLQASGVRFQHDEGKRRMLVPFRNTLGEGDLLVHVLSVECPPLPELLSDEAKSREAISEYRACLRRWVSKVAGFWDQQMDANRRRVADVNEDAPPGARRSALFVEPVLSR